MAVPHPRPGQDQNRHLRRGFIFAPKVQKRTVGPATIGVFGNLWRVLAAIFHKDHYATSRPVPRARHRTRPKDYGNWQGAFSRKGNCFVTVLCILNSFRVSRHEAADRRGSVPVTRRHRVSISSSARTTVATKVPALVPRTACARSTARREFGRAAVQPDRLGLPRLPL